MSDNGATLTVDRQGFISWDGVRLPVRYEGGALEFVVKHPGDRARLRCKRVKIPLDEFKKLERTRAASAPDCEPSKRPPRQRIVSRRNI